MDLKRCLAYRKQCYSVCEIICHVNNPKHDKLIHHTKYVDKPEKVIDFIENNKIIIAKAEPMGVVMAESMTYNILTTRPG